MGEFGSYTIGARVPRRQRVSPVGSREYTEDVNQFAQRHRFGPIEDRTADTRGRFIGALTGDEHTGYDPSMWNEPRVQRHERIHIGQRRLEHQPTPDEVNRIFEGDYGDRKGRAVMEQPAYSMAEDTAFQSQKQAQHAEDYINHLKRLGNSDRAINTIEVSMAPELQRRYLLNHRPPLPNPTPKELLR